MFCGLGGSFSGILCGVISGGGCVLGVVGRGRGGTVVTVIATVHAVVIGTALTAMRRMRSGRSRGVAPGRSRDGRSCWLLRRRGSVVGAVVGDRSSCM